MNIRLNKAIRSLVSDSRPFPTFKKKGCPLESEDNLNQKLDEKQPTCSKRNLVLTRTYATKRRKSDRPDRKKHSAQKTAQPEAEMIATEVPEDMKPRIVSVNKIDLDAVQGKA
ncbi:MAG: hypothetical protein ACLS29_01060 [Prevotellamassilia sp.]